MTRDDLARELEAAVRPRIASNVPLTEAASFPELGLDSADVLELVADLEDRHGVAISLNALGRVRTYGQLLDHLHGLLEAR